MAATSLPKNSRRAVRKKPRRRSDNSPRNERKSLATKLIDACSDLELFHTPDREAFVTVDGEHVKATSTAFADWLYLKCHRTFRTSPGASTIKTVMGALAARARLLSPEHPVHLRVAGEGEETYLHLDKNSLVRATAQGWRIVTKSSCRFYRPDGFYPLPRPTAGGNLNELRRFLNFRDEDQWRLLVMWLLAAFHPQGPYPILILQGEQGTAKSTTSRILAELVDPNGAGPRAQPSNERDLAIAAERSWVLCFDNMSYLQPWLSDALCRIATGASFATRRLFTDDEERVFRLRRPMILNGIEEFATRGDLLERAILIDLPVIPGSCRRTEDEFMSDFRRAKPAILGALLDMFSATLSKIDVDFKGELPRMADFARRMKVAELRLGWPSGSVEQALARNTEAQNRTAIDSSALADALIALCTEYNGVWIGSCMALLTTLGSRVEEIILKSRDWPKSARAMSGQLRRLTPNLRKEGFSISFERENDRARRRIVRIEMIQSSESSDAAGEVPPRLNWKDLDS